MISATVGAELGPGAVLVLFRHRADLSGSQQHSAKSEG
jgi:hypothetical protein